MKFIVMLMAIIMGFTSPTNAGEVTVVDAKAKKGSAGTYQFEVTLRHNDTGWDHYADNWEIVSLDGKVLGKRVLLHPHENEQPFTRSLGNVKIPAGIKEVKIRGHDKVHKHGGKELKISLPGR